MTWQDAKALIDEIRRLKYRHAYAFLDRLELSQHISTHDEIKLIKTYRQATGGGHRIFNHGGC